ncbi:hypothetical protein GUJ93_ZPchr0001g29878 [Zizania palustris]|uniref:Uncharacterized protein n=1 Tax=Zizania palustris TaxID=103762 RepID=A0A8J5V5T3_ZIZPA|nr:hypothetical protein GUJ93_ZPchr0001g29878 [Zizania palustris]
MEPMGCSFFSGQQRRRGSGLPATRQTGAAAKRAGHAVEEGRGGTVSGLGGGARQRSMVAAEVRCRARVEEEACGKEQRGPSRERKAALHGSLHSAGASRAARGRDTVAKVRLGAGRRRGASGEAAASR